MTPVTKPPHRRHGPEISVDDDPRMVDGLGGFGWAMLFIIASIVFVLAANF